MAGDDDEVFMTRSVNVTPKTTKQHLIVRSCKSEAEITIIEECTRIRGIVLLKLTTNRDEASRGLSATAWLLVKNIVLRSLVTDREHMPLAASLSWRRHR